MLLLIQILCILGICQIVQSDPITGTLSPLGTYPVVEGGTAELNLTVTNRNGSEIQCIGRRSTAQSSSEWEYSLTSMEAKDSFEPAFLTNFQTEWNIVNSESMDEFILQINNISKAEYPTQIKCGFIQSETKYFVTFSGNVNIEVWTEPVCGDIGEIPDMTAGHDITLSCSFDGGNPVPLLQWYRRDDDGLTMEIGEPAVNVKDIVVSLTAVYYGGEYVCEADTAAALGENLTCEIIIPSLTISTTTESIEDQSIEPATTEITLMTETTKIVPTETTNQTKSTFGFWTTMMIIVVAAPGGTIILILIIIIVVCLCSCMKQNKTDKTINDIEAASETNTKSDEKTNEPNNHDTATTNGGMKMNEKNETKNGKTDMRKDDAIPVYDDVANEANADKTDGSNGEMMNNGQDKETENTDENGEPIPLYDNMREDKADAPDMSKANVEGLEYADIAIGSAMDGPPNSEDIIRKESATVYADLMV